MNTQVTHNKIKPVKVSDSAKPVDSAAIHPATEDSPVHSSGHAFTKITSAMLKDGRSPAKDFESSMEGTNNSPNKNKDYLPAPDEVLPEELPSWKNYRRIEFPLTNNNLNGTSGEGSTRLSAEHGTEPDMSGFHGTVADNATCMEANEFVHQTDKEASPAEMNLGIEVGFLSLVIGGFIAQKGKSCKIFI